MKSCPWSVGTTTSLYRRTMCSTKEAKREQPLWNMEQDGAQEEEINCIERVLSYDDEDDEGGGGEINLNLSFIP